MEEKAGGQRTKARVGDVSLEVLRRPSILWVLWKRLLPERVLWRVGHVGRPSRRLDFYARTGKTRVHSLNVQVE